MLVSRNHNTFEENGSGEYLRRFGTLQRARHRLRRRDTRKRPHAQVYTCHKMERQGIFHFSLQYLIYSFTNSSVLSLFLRSYR